MEERYLVAEEEVRNAFGAANEASKLKPVKQQFEVEM